MSEYHDYTREKHPESGLNIISFMNKETGDEAVEQDNNHFLSNSKENLHCSIKENYK